MFTSLSVKEVPKRPNPRFLLVNPWNSELTVFNMFSVLGCRYTSECGCLFNVVQCFFG